MTLPILYSFRRCPYAMRARLGLLVSGLQVELREVVLRDKPKDMIAASPKATVPVLILPDGTVLEESLDIMGWALQEDAARPLLDHDPIAQKELIADLDKTFKPALDRYKYPNRYADEPPADHRARALDWITVTLAQRLTDQLNLFSDAPAFADLASFPFIRQYAHVDRDWFYTTAPEPVCNWLLRHLESDLFATIMPKYKQWQPGDAGIVFPQR